VERAIQCIIDALKIGGEAFKNGSREFHFSGALETITDDHNLTPKHVAISGRFARKGDADERSAADLKLKLRHIS
jgi:hypothetical protein